MNLKGSSFIAKDTTGLTVTGNIKVESAVNSYENESKSSYKNSHAKENSASNLMLGENAVILGDVKYGARIDTRDVHTESKSSSFGISAGINSPILDRAKQAGNAVKQVKDGDTAGGVMTAINAVTGTIKGLADNQGTRQTNYDVNGSVGKQGVQSASANNNFYANVGLNAGFSKSKSSSNSHTESAVVTTMKPTDENSSITYNNVKNIEYQGTQAQGGTFVYNNVENIRKEAVELHNSSNSSSSSKGISASATVGYGHKMQTTGNGGSISASKSNQNTEETMYQNGNFANINEVHNNTGSMIISGFNQDGGKLIGNIGKVEVTSKQNTSTTTGSSKGMSVGVSSQGIPTSVNVNASKTNGNRNFVDNQSSFTVGEGSNLQVGTLENTGAIIGKQSENATFKIDNYVGKNLQNDDEMKTTGGAIGVSTGKPKVTSLEFSQDSRDKEGVTRNTVVGNVEIGQASGDEINRDLSKANEVTKDSRSSTNVSVESQTIEYATDSGKLKEDLGKAKKEISDVTRAVKESINDRGDDNRNFFGQLREIRLNETVNNIAGERLKKADKSEDIVSAWKDAYKDLGYNLDVKYTTGEDTPEMKNKAGTAYVSESGVHTIILNINAEENQTKAGLIGTLAEEASHIVNGVAGRQIETGTEEKGLESTGRAANAYFKEKYKDSKQGMTYVSDGKIDTSKLGTNVGDDAIYIGPKFNAGPIFQGGVGFGGYLINTGKGFQVGFGISGSVGGATGAGISGGGDIVYYPYAKDKSDVSKNYFSVNIAVQHKILLGGSLGVTAYIPLKNGNLDFSSNGIGIGLSAEAFAGMGLEGIGASSNYSTGVNYWMTDFSGKMANMISNEIEKLKKDYNLTGLTNEAMKYLTGHKKDIEKLFKKKGKR